MARNGSGVYSLPGTYLAVSGETIEAQQHNDPLEDLEADANNARPIVAGGTGAASAADARTNLGVNTAISDAIDALIPSGTAMLFKQTSAPTGWTKDTTHNDKALRVVSGTAGTGGSADFTTAFGARTIAQANLPNVNFTVTIPSGQGSHTHGEGGGTSFLNSGAAGTLASGSFQTYNFSSTTAAATLPAMSGTAASGGSGTAMDFAVKYVDVIIATKD